MSRIDRIGKGRYAQRVASHVSKLDLRSRAVEVLGAVEDEVLDRDDLLEVPGCGPLLALLDDLRRSVQGLPLLPTTEQYREWLFAHQDTDETEGDEDDEAEAAVLAEADGGAARPRRVLRPTGTQRA